MIKKAGILSIIILTVSLLFGAEIREQKIINMKKTYTIGDTIEYRLKIKTNGQKYKIEESEIKNLEIIYKNNNIKDNMLIIYRKYQLFNTNIKKLPDFILINDKGEKQVINGLKIDVKSVLSPKTKNIDDIIPPMKNLKTGYSPLPLIISIILFLFVLILLYILYKKLKNRSKKDDIPEKIWEKEIDPLEYLKDRWMKTDINGYLKRGKEKELFYELSEILKTFLSIYYKKNYIDMTSRELISAFKKEPHSELSEDISKFLEQADLIKFAKKIPVKDEEIEYAKSFFNKIIDYYEKLAVKEGINDNIDHTV
jgi:hypothetical protein